MKDIHIFVPNQVIGMSATLLKELCWVAGLHAAEKKGSTLDPGKHVHLVSIDGKSAQCFTGNSLSVDMALDEVEHSDAIFLSSFWGAPHKILEENQALQKWLVQSHAEGIPIAGMSNAPFFMAEAGLLNDKVATIYPPVADQFQQRYPQVNLRQERAITDAGNLYCANGIASGCDLIVSMIEMFYGPEVARQMSQEFLIGFNRSYTLANVGFDGQKYHRDRQILTAQQWLERNFHEDVKLETLAEDVGMSPRNFSRRFKLATGDSPSHYLQRVRMDAAKDLLRSSSMTVAEVAYKVGYSDVSYFSRMFNRHEGCLPHTFRDEVE